MSAESAVLAGRAAAEALMTDACTITRGGTRTFDEDTGRYVVVGGATIYSGRCKLQTENVQVTNPDVAGRAAVVVRERIDLPVNGSGSVRSGDTVLMTTCRLDAAVVGKTFTIDGPHLGSAKTARRLPVKAEVTAWA